MGSDFVYAIVGAAVGWILSQYSSIASENANIIRSHIIDIEKFNEAVENYWLCNPQSKFEEQRLASIVKARQAAISTFYGEAGKRLSRKQCQDYQVLQIRLFRAATGGDFETARRKIDSIRAIDSYRLSSELVHLLRIAGEQAASPVGVIQNWISKIGQQKQRDNRQ